MEIHIGSGAINMLTAGCCAWFLLQRCREYERNDAPTALRARGAVAYTAPRAGLLLAYHAVALSAPAPGNARTATMLAIMALTGAVWAVGALALNPAPVRDARPPALKPPPAKGRGATHPHAGPAETAARLTASRAAAHNVPLGLFTGAAMAGAQRLAATGAERSGSGTGWSEIGADAASVAGACAIAAYACLADREHTRDGG